MSGSVLRSHGVVAREVQRRGRFARSTQSYDRQNAGTKAAFKRLLAKRQRAAVSEIVNDPGWWEDEPEYHHVGRCRANGAADLLVTVYAEGGLGERLSRREMRSTKEGRARLAKLRAISTHVGWGVHG